MHEEVEITRQESVTFWHLPLHRVNRTNFSLH